MSSLSGKVALVTGGAQGIGLAIAKLLLQNKAKVAILDIDSTMGTASCGELRNEFTGSTVKFYQTDISKEDELKDAFMKTKEDLGGIDIVCNNAGITESDNWRSIININLVALIDGTLLGIDYMSTKKGGNGGCIINIASLAGIVPAPTDPVYCASKHGVIGFSRSMAIQAAKDSVRVNCVCPSFVRTRLVDLDHAKEVGLDKLIDLMGLAEPADVAEVVLELITDTSKTGAVVSLTGKEKKYVKLMEPQEFLPKQPSI